jgi:hypothetical protein
MDRAEGDNRRPITWHRYAYASDQPTNHLDPSGNDDIGGFGDVGSVSGIAEGITSVDGLVFGAGAISSQARLLITIYSSHIGWLPVVSADHLYLVYTDGNGIQTAFEGGPDHFPTGAWDWFAWNWGFLGTGEAKTSDPKFLASHDPNSDPWVVVMQGSAVVGKDACFRQAENAINTIHAPYSPFGPNSNTAAAVMCQMCGVPFVTPLGSNPYGWDTEFPPEVPPEPVPLGPGQL